MAPRRPAARRVRRPTVAASSSARTPNRSPCWSSPTSSACPSPTTSGSARASACWAATRVSSAPATSRRSSTRWRGSTTTSPTYIEDRRREPRADVLTDLALAKYPDGSTPDVPSVVRSATFLFAAGQETTARLLATALKYLAEYPELQDELRAHRDRIPDFIEEALRIESPVKADFRLARRSTTIGGVDIPAGHAGDAAQRCRQPGPTAVRVPRRVPGRPPEHQGAHRVRTRHPLLPRRARWRGPRAASASSASSTGCTTSASPRSTTGPPATGGSSTSRPGSSAGSTSSTSSSPRSSA